MIFTRGFLKEPKNPTTGNPEVSEVPYHGLFAIPLRVAMNVLVIEGYLRTLFLPKKKAPSSIPIASLSEFAFNGRSAPDSGRSDGGRDHRSGKLGPELRGLLFVWVQKSV